MYATIHAAGAAADGDPQDVVRATLPAGTEPIGSVVLDHLDGPGRTVLALWADEAAAQAAAEPVYEVTAEQRGRDFGRTPLFAETTWLNGDGDRARADAAEHGGRDRIWPAVRDIEGIVVVLALRSADDRIVVVALGTASETFDEVRRAVLATELLPDEDPALLPGADRAERARVRLAQLPTVVRS